MNTWFAKASHQRRWLIVLMTAMAMALFAKWMHHRSHLMVPASTCAGKLEQLDLAVTQWATSGNKAWNEHSGPMDLRPYFRGQVLPTCESGGQFPPCPQGGKYQVGAASNYPVCTIIGHTLN